MGQQSAQSKRTHRDYTRRSSTRKGGRDGVETRRASRRSRSLRGKVPVEQKSLYEVQRKTRGANAAQRKVPLEEKESSVVEDESFPESSVQDGHQVLAVNNSAAEDCVDDGEDGAGSVGSEPDFAENKSGTPDEADEASEGDAVLVDPPVAGRVSDTCSRMKKSKSWLAWTLSIRTMCLRSRKNARCRQSRRTWCYQAPKSPVLKQRYNDNVKKRPKSPPRR
ncbi:hypothetical protein PC112_g2126 [Phytophthora cactorum]|nr:hypothetical protein PC112_g2126 [Phytophthora cactorum]